MGGKHEFKVCPMGDPNSEVTQECLDSNVLEILPNQASHAMNMSIPGDKYRAKVHNFDGDFVINAKLPDGLVCSHCVLQWTWAVANTRGVYPNGTRAHGLGPRETFRNCADISIKKSVNDNQVYKAVPLEKTPTLLDIYEDTPIVFTCAAFGPAPPRNPAPDLYLYNGTGLICYHLNRYNQDCDMCRRNCSTPNTICPDICQCRWYGPYKTNQKSETTSTTAPISTSIQAILTTSSIPTTFSIQTSPSDQTTQSCPKDDLKALKGSECKKFIRCVGTKIYIFDCPDGWGRFNQTTGKCETNAKSC